MTKQIGDFDQDSAGNKYFLDTNKNRIFKMNITDGLMTPIAGNGGEYSGVNQSTIIDFSPDGKLLYTAFYNSILKLDLTDSANPKWVAEIGSPFVTTPPAANSKYFFDDLSLISSNKAVFPGNIFPITYGDGGLIFAAQAINATTTPAKYVNQGLLYKAGASPAFTQTFGTPTSDQSNSDFVINSINKLELPNLSIYGLARPQKIANGFVLGTWTCTTADGCWIVAKKGGATLTAINGSAFKSIHLSEGIEGFRIVKNITIGTDGPKNRLIYCATSGNLRLIDSLEDNPKESLVGMDKGLKCKGRTILDSEESVNGVVRTKTLNFIVTNNNSDALAEYDLAQIALPVEGGDAVAQCKALNSSDAWQVICNLLPNL